MNRLLLIAGAFALAAGPVLAADLPPSMPPPPPPRAPAAYVPVIQPYYNWGGIYIGINGGYGFASGNSVVTLSGNAFGNGTATGGGNIQGGLAGGTIGANFQSGAFVFGIEGDGDWSGQSKTDSLVCGGGCTVSESAKIPWLATLRGRAGVAWDRVLIFGTAGGAAMNATDTVTATSGGVTGTLISLSDTAYGWTAGGGIEVALTDNITAKVEYLFVQAKPTATATVPALLGGGTVTESVTINDSLVRAGINLKFNPF
jgi:outer membrane immunogenic protein